MNRQAGNPSWLNRKQKNRSRLLRPRLEILLHRPEIAPRTEGGAGAGENRDPNGAILIQPLDRGDDRIDGFAFRDRIAHRRIVQGDRDDLAILLIEDLFGHYMRSPGVIGRQTMDQDATRAFPDFVQAQAHGA